MTTEEIQSRKQAAEIVHDTAIAIRKLLTDAEKRLGQLDEEYDENEILNLVTDDA